MVIFELLSFQEALKKSVLDLLTKKGAKLYFNLDSGSGIFQLLPFANTDLMFVLQLIVGSIYCSIKKPRVIMVVGVNGGGKTTSLGKMKN